MLIINSIRGLQEKDLEIIKKIRSFNFRENNFMLRTQKKIYN